jgi:beta-N-acetylhexosaminidase
MKPSQIKIGFISIIVLIMFLALLSILNYKAAGLTSKIEELKSLGLDTSSYEKKNNIANFLQGKTATLENEVQEKIKSTRISNQLEISNNRDEMLRIVSILNKYKQDQISINDYKSLKDQRFDLSQYKNQLIELSNNRKEKQLTTNALWNISIKEIDNSIANASISDLVGQVMTVGVEGQYLDSVYMEKIKDFNPGGIILMGKNINNPEQVKALTNQLNSIKNTYPLLITTDQEGGVVKRIPWDTTLSVDKWSALSTIELCDQATTRANFLTDLGINNNLAPVSDLSLTNQYAFINNRTISPDPDKSSLIIKDYLQCYQKHNSATLKHFPGHGMVTGDSHLIIPSNTSITKDQWDKTHAVPFKGNTNADMILSAHIVINQVDIKPASMSTKWLNGILRQELKYNGVIITDDMNQYKNISNENMTSSAINALEAGNDMLLYVPNFETLTSIKEDLIKYYTPNRQALESKVRRIVQLKARM